MVSRNSTCFSSWRALLPRGFIASCLAAVGAAMPASAADEIHWTIMGQTAVTFDWRGSETTIEFGTSPGSYTRSVTSAAPSPMPNSSAGPFQEARITGLAENTLYYYRIGTGTESTFRTPPPRGSSGFWIAAEADIGTSTSYATVIPNQQLIAADSPNLSGDDRPRFVLVAGDLTYGDDHGRAHVDQHFNDVMVWSRFTAYMPAWGNHEWGSSEDDLQNYEGRFDLPNTQTSPGAPSAGGPGDDWYWFDYGNARFIAFPEPYSGAWSDWKTKAGVVMAAAQADTAIKFIVTYGHRPAYSSGSDHGGEPSIATIMRDLHALHSKYVMNIQGHTHHYERTDPAQTDGIVHIITGGGGSSLGGLASSAPSWSVYRMEHVHHLKLYFAADRIQGYCVCGPAGAGNSDNCTEGSIVDSWTVMAPGGGPPPPPPPPPTTGSADEVHWTLTGQTAVTFDWRGTANVIRYGPTSSYSDSVVAFTPVPLPFSSAGPFREARITGLSENTVYHYSVGGSADRTFRTPIPRGSSDFVIMVEGDIGETGSYGAMGPVQSQIAAAQPHFVLAVGDLTYGNSHGQVTVDQHFNDVMTWSRQAAYMPAWGNHEWDIPSADDLRNYKGRFDLPNPQTSPGSPSVSCCGEDWYWFDYGNVRFIAYPEPWSGAWADWNTRARAIMDAAQVDAAITFIVTFGHRPAYSSGHHPGESTLKGYLDALGASHSKYVLNLNAHSHNYERSHPQSGVVHVTAGGGGSTLETESGSCPWLGGCPAPSWSAFRAFRHGPLKLRFTPTTIEGEALCGPASSRDDITCTQGNPYDTFRINASGGVADGVPPAPPANLRLRP